MRITSKLIVSYALASYTEALVSLSGGGSGRGVVGAAVVGAVGQKL